MLLICLFHLLILEKKKFLLHLYWLHIGQQVYEGIAVQNNISNMAIIVGIVGAIIGYGLNVKWIRGVDMRKVIILLLCLVLVSCGTTNKSKSTTKDTSVNSFFGFKKKVKEKLIYKKDKSMNRPCQVDRWNN